jgi:tartrate dehydrogenase/decarboxylase/D-malate dehydrogenase
VVDELKYHHIALLPGDGIGKEVLPAAMKVLNTAAEIFGFRIETVQFPWSCDYYLQHGHMMPPDGLRELRGFDAIFLGAVGDPTRVPDHVSLHGLLLTVRKEFNQYVNVRPHRLLPGVKGPLRTENQFDILCIRENSEGEYAGAGGRVHIGTPGEVALETSVFTRAGVERVLRHGFEQARLRKRKLTSCTKSNAQKYTMVFWDEMTEWVAKDYPDVSVTRSHVDALAARMITHPHTLDVIVASNLFGDILTDIGAAIQGGLGFAASGNINPTREMPSMFEPVHGSAPDIYGQQIANPLATIWAGAMMFEHLGETKAAEAVVRAMEAVTAAAEVATPDMGGRNRTVEVAEAVAKAVTRIVR